MKLKNSINLKEIPPNESRSDIIVRVISFFLFEDNFIFNYFRIKQIQHLSIKEPNNNPIIYCTSKILAKIVSSPQRQSDHQSTLIHPPRLADS